MVIDHSPNFESKFLNDFINLAFTKQNFDSFLSSNNLLKKENELDSLNNKSLNCNKIDSNNDTLLGSKSAVLLSIERLPGGGNTFGGSLIKKRKERRVTFQEAVNRNRIIYQASNTNLEKDMDRQEAGGKGSDKDKTNKSNKNDSIEMENDICCELFPLLFCNNKVAKTEPLVTAFGSGTLTNCGKNLLYENIELPKFQTPKEYEHLLIIDEDSNKDSNPNKTAKSSGGKSKNMEQTSLLVKITKLPEIIKNKIRRNAGSDINEKPINIKRPNKPKNLVLHNKIRFNAGGGDSTKVKYDSEGRLIPTKTSKRLIDKIIKDRAQLLSDTEAFDDYMDNLKYQLVQYIDNQKMMRELRRPTNRTDIARPEVIKIYWDAKFDKVRRPSCKCCCPK